MDQVMSALNHRGRSVCQHTVIVVCAVWGTVLSGVVWRGAVLSGVVWRGVVLSSGSSPGSYMRAGWVSTTSPDSLLRLKCQWLPWRFLCFREGLWGRL